MRFLLHPGSHSAETRSLVHHAWTEGECLILCPPRVKDFSFMEALPSGEIEILGDWETRKSSVREAALKHRNPIAYPDVPRFGVFSSGTTSGDPKLVLYSKNNIETSLAGIMSLFDETRITSVFSYPQPSHTFGLVLGYLLTEIYKLQLHTGEGKYSTEFHKLRSEIKAPNLLTLGTPTHFRDLISFLNKNELSLAPSYSAIVGGAPVTRTLWNELKNTLHIEAPSIGYGATEASPGITHLPPGIEPVEDSEIGYPLPDTTVAPSLEGLTFKGPGLGFAVIQKRNITFPTSGRLSDRIEARSDERLVYCGRLEACLNRGGEKFSLEHIEMVLRERFGAETLCVSLPHPRLGEELGVLVKTSELSAPTIEQFQTALFEVFHNRFAEANWKALDSLPSSETGKPDRLAAIKIICQSSFPYSALQLKEAIPHRPPMVWIQEVIHADRETGKCRFVYHAKENYSDATGIRPSSFIELMAQSYAFSQAAFAKASGNALAMNKAYLAGVSDLKIEANATRLVEGDELTVEVRCYRKLGPLSLVKGRVSTPAGNLVAAGDLKLFAE